jgi:hypothetical protein
MVPYPERSRFEQAVKQKGPPTMPDEWGGNFTPLGQRRQVRTPGWRSRHADVRQADQDDRSERSGNAAENPRFSNAHRELAVTSE